MGRPAVHGSGGRKEERKPRIGRTHKTPVEVYQFRAGTLDERPGETTPLWSVPRNESVLLVVVIVFFVIRFRFQGESAFGLKEKPDRIACHPQLWLFERQYVVDILGEYLNQAQFEIPSNRIRPRCDSPFPDTQPRLVAGYSSPTPRQDPAS